MLHLPLQLEYTNGVQNSNQLSSNQSAHSQTSQTKSQQSSNQAVQETRQNPASWWQRITTHASFWLFNGGLIFWLFAAVLSNNSLLSSIFRLLPPMFVRLEPAGLIGAVSLLLLVVTPAIGLFSYILILFKKKRVLKKLWLLQLQQLLLLLFSGFTFFATQIGFNLGILLLLFIVELLPLQSILSLNFDLMPNSSKNQSKSTLIFMLVLNTLMLTVVSYLSLLVLFIIPIFMYGLVMIVVEFTISFSLVSLIWLILSLIGALVAISIFSLPYIYTRKVYQKVTSLFLVARSTIGRHVTLAITVGSGALLIALVVLAAQPVPKVYTQKLESFARNPSFETKKQLAQELKTAERQIEVELLSASSAKVRYLINPNYESLVQFYEDGLNLPYEIANAIEKVFLFLAHPLVEPPTASSSYRRDYQTRTLLNQAFEDLFGYAAGESDSEFSHLVENSDSVSLVERSISGQTFLDGQLAEITITEEYVNSDSWDQEISYVFSLPPSAVITDLKLGPTLEYQGQIAPRGAAEQVFNEQVRVNRDPALLEMVGPSQYRLRVFPIPPKNDENQTGNQKVSYSYVTLLEPEGYSLPRYGTEQNLETNLTKIVGPELDGQKVKSNREETFITSSKQYCQLAVSAGLERSAISTQVCESGSNLVSSLLPQNKNITLIIDISARKDEETTRQALREFFSKNQQFLAENQVEVITVNNSGSENQQLSLQNWEQWFDELVFFGQHDTAKVLLSVPTNSDLVLVVGNSQAAVSLPAGVAENTQPADQFYWLYLEGSPPPITQNVLQQLLQQQVMVTTSFEDALVAWQSQQTEKQNGLVFSPYWRYSQPAWTLSDPADSYEQLETQVAPLQKLVTAELIKEWVSEFSFDRAINIQNNFGRFPPIPVPALETNSTALGSELSGESLPETPLADQLNLLDYLHEVAKDEGIVTAYSSYIALVNQEQQQRLDQLSLQSDRFATNVPRVSNFESFNPGVGSFRGDISLNKSSGFSSAGTFSGISALPPSGSNERQLSTSMKAVLVGVFATLLLATGVGSWWFLRRKRKAT